MTATISQLGGLLLACLMATGCAALNVRQPTASIRSAAVDDLTADGLTVNFDVDVQNPNAVSIPLSGAKYKLALGGVPVLDDQARPDASIPANGSLPVKLPVRLSFQNLLSAEQAIAGTGGNVPYRFDGSLEFSPGKFPLAQPVRVPLHYSDTLRLRDAFEKAARDPAIWSNPDARRVIEAVVGKGILGHILGR